MENDEKTKLISIVEENLKKWADKDEDNKKLYVLIEYGCDNTPDILYISYLKARNDKIFAVDKRIFNTNDISEIEKAEKIVNMRSSAFSINEVERILIAGRLMGYW